MYRFLNDVYERIRSSTIGFSAVSERVNPPSPVIISSKTPTSLKRDPQRKNFLLRSPNKSHLIIDAKSLISLLDVGAKLNDPMILSCFQSLVNVKTLTNRDGTNIESYKELVPLIQDINYTTAPYYFSYLYFACSVGYSELVSLILERGADRNSVNTDGEDALCIASRKGHLEAVKVLMKWTTGKPIPTSRINTAFRAACWSGRAEVIPVLKYLIEHGADVNSLTEHGQSPLSIAISCYGTDIVELLLNNGAHVHTLTPNDRCMLCYACTQKSPEIVNLLLHHGADPNTIDRDGACPLYLARSNERIMQLLFDNGADVNLPLTNGSTVFLNILKEACVQVCSLYIIKWYLNHGADTNRPNTDTGETALMIAALTGTGSVPIVKLLLESCADVTQPNHDGICLLYMVANNNRGDNNKGRIIELCIQYIDINRIDEKPLLK